MISDTVVELEQARTEIKRLFAAHKNLLEEVQEGCTHPEVWRYTRPPWGGPRDMHICPACGKEIGYPVFKRPLTKEISATEFIALKKKFAPLVAE